MIAFVAALGVASIWFLHRRRDQRPSLAALIAVPAGCLAFPIFGLVMVAVVHNLTRSSDTELFEELIGYPPTISEDRLLFDDFGSGPGREIYMRAEPSDSERNRLMSIPNGVESDFTLNRFIAWGESQGLSWWLSTSERSGGYCKSARILDAHGFRGWEEFRIAECLDSGTEFPASANKGNIYVIAMGRPE